MVSSDLARDLVEAVDAGSLNRARIDLQRSGTPEEIRSASEHSESFPEHVVDWIRRIHDYCFWEKSYPEPFERAETHPEWTLFRGPGITTTKELVIGFAGAMGNVNHGSAAILQQLDAGERDLLIVRDLTRRSFSDGAAGTSSFDEFVEKLRMTAAGYRSCVTLGSSMGGGPALEAGVRLGARRAISLSGGPKIGLTEGRAGWGAPTEVWCLYGQENHHDAEKAIGLGAIYPGARLLALPGVRDHNITKAAFWSGTLQPLFRLMLADRTDAEVLIGSSDAKQPTICRLAPTCAPPAWAVEQSQPRSMRAPARRMLGWVRRATPPWRNIR